MGDVRPSSSDSGSSQLQDCRVMIALVKDQMTGIFSLPTSRALYSGVASYFIRDKFYGRFGKYQCQCQ